MKTLFLALEDFRSRDRGSRIRDWYNVEALATLGEVTVLCFSPGSTIDARWDIEGAEFLIDDPTSEGKALARAVLHGTMYHVERYNFANHKDAEAVRDRGFDLVVASLMYSMPYLEQVVGPPDTRPPVLWDTHNFDPDVWDVKSRTGSIPQRVFARMMRPRAAALVNRSILLADGIVACTTVDRDSWQSISGGTPVMVAPNAADIDAWAGCRTTSGDPNTFILFGSLNQDSTQAGTLWFLENVWPGYVKEHPEAQIIVAGRDPHRDVVTQARSASRVELVANPVDLMPVVERAGTIVVPQVWGTGSKLKMVEALASGRRVVASPSAAVGLPTEIAEFVDIAESVENWHEAMGQASSGPRSTSQSSELVEHLSKTLSWRASQRHFIEAAQAVTTP